MVSPQGFLVKDLLKKLYALLRFSENLLFVKSNILESKHFILNISETVYG